MQDTANETLLANDRHTYMRDRTEAAKLEMPPHIQDSSKWEWDGVTTGICVIVQAAPRLFVPPSSSFWAWKDFAWIGRRVYTHAKL
jgi:hypothetical protein